ncbi:MAG TPA: metallophosphoesterase [Candidatus Bacteroides avicola]|uniref:Metallophosphoesterase n=1 Tax=Candidatus Bacteroides avicola TaxID=2838468 RepID=A0A9D2HYA4_9BACE|nr:metallophosphoesterase [Candidatus Bacteroides avicola]
MRKTVLYQIYILLAALSLFSCTKKEVQPVRFAIVSDLHAPDIPDGLERMQAVVEAANRENVDFLIQLGDFIRLDSADIPYRKVWDEFKGEKYHVLGNHDLDRYTKEEYVAGLNMPGRYYSFDKGDFHFIVLDGNNLYDGKEYKPYARANYYVDSKMRAFMDPEQMEWLKKDLAATDKRCIIFSHQSIDTSMNNGSEVRSILEEENRRSGFQKVALAFSGHDHSNYTKEINGITYVQINSASYVWIEQPSMTEKRYPQEINERYSLLSRSITYDKALYGIVTLTGEGAEIKGTKGNFMPPTPKEVGLGDSIGVFPLVSSIEDVKVTFKD